jgi:signal transduction histidine kinase
LSLGEIIDDYTQSPEVQVARLEMMLAVSRSLNSTLDLEALLQSIVEVATQLTGTEAASVLLLDKKTGELYFGAVTGKKQLETERIRVPLEGSIGGWILQNDDVLVIDNIQDDERHSSEIDWITSFVTRSILGIPLKDKHELVGVLEVINKHHNLDFSGDDVHTLNLLAAQASVAIENARLFRQGNDLASIVHELRAPMTSVIGFSQLMLTKPDMDPEDLQIGLECINREATYLGQIVDNFLDLTRLETGRVRMATELVDLQSLAQEVIELCSVLANEKEIDFSLNVENTIPEIEGDTGRLKQVIVNLVDNAIKYNRAGGLVDITLSCNAVRVQLSVRNTGSGIASDELGLVFDKFYRGEEARKGKGAGLGLPIAKKIVEAHGGDIWVESEVGVGSNFTFSLPFRSDG